MEHISTTRSWEQPSTAYRVDLDHRGDWCVWRQLPGGGWTAIQSCVSHNDAVNRVAQLNAKPRISFGGPGLGRVAGI